MNSKINKQILTIVVPSYKTAPFIGNSLSNFIDPRFFGRVSVFLIDDGSPDEATPNMLKQLANEYPNLFKYFRKENGGHGSVINYAIQLIKTKYFKIIDGDDTVCPDSLNALLYKLESSDDDMILTDYVNVYSSSPNTEIVVKPTDETFNASVEIPSDKLNSFHITIQNVTFKTSIWVNNSIKVREHVFYEDREYCLFPLPYIKTFSYFPYPVYRYSLGSPSQSVSLSSLSKHFYDHYLLEKDLFSFYETTKKQFPFISKIVGSEASKLFYTQLVASIYLDGYALPKRREKRKCLLSLYKIIKNDDFLSSQIPNRKLVKITTTLNFHFLPLMGAYQKFFCK